MELNSIHGKISSPSIHEQLKCEIGRNEISRGTTIYQEGLMFGVGCEQCYKNNSPEELELMAN